MTTPNNWWLCCQAVHQRAKAQTLAGLADQNIRLMPVANEKDIVPLPGVLVAPFGAETLDPSTGGNAMDDPGYPVLVAIVDSKQNVINGGSAWLETWLQWRETLIAALHHKNGTDFTADGATITGQSDTIVIPGSVISGPAWNDRQVAVGTFVVRVTVRRTHT